MLALARLFGEVVPEQGRMERLDLKCPSGLSSGLVGHAKLTSNGPSSELASLARRAREGDVEWFPERARLDLEFSNGPSSELVENAGMAPKGPPSEYSNGPSGKLVEHAKVTSNGPSSELG